MDNPAKEAKQVKSGNKEVLLSGVNQKNSPKSIENQAHRQQINLIKDLPIKLIQVNFTTL